MKRMTARKAKANIASNRAQRANIRARGYRLLRLWVPDVKSEAFRLEAHRQSLAVANDPQEIDDQAFIDSISDLPGP